MSVARRSTMSRILTTACMASCLFAGAALAAENIRIRPQTNADDMPPDPRLTEVWFPVPAKVTPGAAAGAPPSDAIVLFDGRNIDAWKSARGGDAKWTVANGEMIVAPGTGDIQTKA